MSQQHQFGRFPLYSDYFASIGHPIKDNMRGGGIRWIVRFFGRVSPVHFVLYLASLSLLVILLIVGVELFSQAWQLVAVLVLSVSPLLVGEITHGPQHSRSYFPGLIGLVLLIAYAAFQLDQELTNQGRVAFGSILGAAVLAGGVWSIWMYLDDVLPARMAGARLRETLRSLAVTEFYTYDTPYNGAFINALAPEELQRYKIHYIDSIRDVKEGYIVVPGTSSMALNVEGTRLSYEHDDYNLDKDLNRLIKSKEIEKYAVASFKTFGTSRIWVHEAPVLSYCDLILNEISEYDRWRGRAWVLDAAKLQAGERFQDGHSQGDQQPLLSHTALRT